MLCEETLAIVQIYALPLPEISEKEAKKLIPHVREIIGESINTNDVFAYNESLKVEEMKRALKAYEMKSLTISTYFKNITIKNLNFEISTYENIEEIIKNYPIFDVKIDVPFLLSCLDYHNKIEENIESHIQTTIYFAIGKSGNKEIFDIIYSSLMEHRELFIHFSLRGAVKTNNERFVDYLITFPQNDNTYEDCMAFAKNLDMFSKLENKAKELKIELDYEYCSLRCVHKNNNFILDYLIDTKRITKYIQAIRASFIWQTSHTEKLLKLASDNGEEFNFDRFYSEIINRDENGIDIINHVLQYHKIDFNKLLSLSIGSKNIEIFSYIMEIYKDKIDKENYLENYYATNLEFKKIMLEYIKF